MMRQRALLLINAKSRRGQCDADLVRTHLTNGGLELIQPRLHDADISKLILQHAPHVNLIILGGGDGTINRALTSLLKARLPVEILPLGTANDLARTLQFHRNRSPERGVDRVSRDLIRATELRRETCRELLQFATLRRHEGGPQ